MAAVGDDFGEGKETGIFTIEFSRLLTQQLSHNLDGWQCRDRHALWARGREQGKHAKCASGADERVE